MFEVRRKSDVPLTEQIVREISERIQTGMLASQTQLPSVRTLANRLGVSLVTVVQAYRVLEQRGFVERIQGKGTYVRTRTRTPEQLQPTAPHQRFDWQLLLADYLPRAAVFRQHTESVDETPLKLSMAALCPSLSAASLPADLYTSIVQMPAMLTEYGPVEGLPSLRARLAVEFREAGLAVDVDEIFITNGVQQAIDIVARTFLGPGDVVVVEAPTYAGALDVFRACGANVISIPVDDQGLRTDLLLRQCDHKPPKLIYTMPAFHNPTSVVMSQQRRRALLDIATSYQCLILEDDSFSDCSFGVAVPPPLRADDDGGHVVYVRGFSKVFLPGCRLAAVVASGSVRNRLVAAKSVSDLGSPLITQRLVEHCLMDSGRRRRIEKIVNALRIKRDLALQTLAEHAPPGVTWNFPDGGYNLWVTLPDHVNADVLLVEAMRKGISFLPGSACYNGDLVYHHLRISYSYLEDDELVRAVRALCLLMSEAVTGQSRPFMPVI
ncbi:aminotransferase-like domain-containing protein [Alicyclobacillus fastidiosus]|uniref:PLP-dependent aminotransferase family protein n=1 Tax=Alicyclobacillus fastidiosus TaxID=392011 RepID=A0ABV5AC53_9BACL|nr:PLP-dependent aminotransferase family protein [Alicyclobacillus fastidiosus]WEH11440.1 PLP-dependent aminotransferase family protein [Alicyclobacillus fastidiosus]